ncbi:helix-turn-helix transcriptional regulator [Natrinema halophilum]|uniref:Helix-turn-helix transcriptional regulator n=1 Tax=Natrinema halophilum TaxID=1699371 RepID=A0A7D5KJA4_9EURY|nr:helix-turn-helix transcriptional regulator [Natrinema halophilum]QLG49299.1 helix-turn-helix transcriptional regulator [Natrinema halophilum]
MQNNLKVWRAREDLTQEALADEVDVTRQTINSIERDRYDPSLELAFKLAAYFDCRIEDIFTYHPDEDT